MKKTIKTSCFICIIAVITVFSSCSNKKVYNNSDVDDITFNGLYPEITVFSQTDDGTFASIEAVEGHAIVIFNKTTPYGLAVEIIENLSGVILSSRHNSNYFLVEVGIGNENNFLSQIKQYKAVKFACYNSTSCNEDAIRSLTGNFNNEYNNGVNATNSSFWSDYISDDNSETKYLNQILEMLNDNFNNANNFEERHNYGSEYEYEYESENEYVNDDIIKIEDNYEEYAETSTPISNNNANDIVVSRTKELFIATANGDIETLKRLLTPDFYRDNYPFSDEKNRELLLEVPIYKRERLRNDIINNSLFTIIPNSAGDVITVIFTNSRTNKDMTIQFIDEAGDGDWRIFEYYYY